MKNLSIILVVVILILNSHIISARRRHRIPAPVIEDVIDNENSPNGIVIIKGKGFINNYPEAHRVILLKQSRKIKARAINATAETLTIRLPKNIEYGDYDIYIKIRTRLLKSHKSTSSKQLLLRPAAPTMKQLSYQSISNDNELEFLQSQSHFQGHPLFYELKGKLKIGLNHLRTYYKHQGFTSVKSKPRDFYYLPELAFENELTIESETPLQSYAVTKFDINSSGSNTKYDVSDVTNKEIQELSKHFYLKTPSKPRYLEHTIELSPVFISELHVLEEEYAVLSNRSSQDFNLAGCTLADNTRVRFEFDQEIIVAQSSLTITHNLGLNNTSPDSLSLECAGKLVDQYRYENVNSNGFGI